MNLVALESTPLAAANPTPDVLLSPTLLSQPGMSTMIVDSCDLSFHVDLAEQLVILVLECNLSRIPTGHNGYPRGVPNIPAGNRL